MTEAEWLICTDPQAMLYVVQGPPPEYGGFPTTKISDRKLRLFACACCRKVWHLLTDARSRQAVEVAERHADGQCSTEEYHGAWSESWDAGVQALPDPSPLRAVSWLFGKTNYPGSIAAEVVALLCPSISSPVQAALLRDICGNPWRLPPTHKELARHGIFDWNGNTIPRLASAAYEERPGRKCERCGGTGWVGRYREAMNRDDCPDCHGSGRIEDGSLDNGSLTILADALEDAGCVMGCIHCVDGVWGEYDDDARTPILCQTPGCALLAHLRDPGPHVRGCWVLDMLLDKE